MTKRSKIIIGVFIGVVVVIVLYRLAWWFWFDVLMKGAY